MEEWHGRPYTHQATQLRETVAAVRKLLVGKRVEYEGELTRMKGYRLRLPLPRSSIAVAAFGDRAIGIAAFADRMVINLCTPAVATTLKARLAAHARAAGRDTPSLAAWLPACIGPDEAAFAQAASALVGYLAAPGYADGFAEAGFRRPRRVRPHSPPSA